MWFNLLIFLLTTASITYGLTRSRGIRPIREWVTRENRAANELPVDQKKVLKNPIYWFLEHFFSCYYCNGFYSGTFAWLLLKYEIWFACYILIGALVTLIIISITKQLKD